RLIIVTAPVAQSARVPLRYPAGSAISSLRALKGRVSLPPRSASAKARNRVGRRRSEGYGWPGPRNRRGTAIPAPGSCRASSITLTQPGVSRTRGLRISTAPVAGKAAIAAWAAAAKPRFPPRSTRGGLGAVRRTRSIVPSVDAPSTTTRCQSSTPSSASGSDASRPGSACSLLYARMPTVRLIAVRYSLWVGWSQARYVASGAGDRGFRAVPDIAGPDVPAPAVEVRGRTELPAVGVVLTAEPVADDPDVVALRAARFRAAVDAVATARDQVVLDQLVGLDAEVLKQADGVGLVQVHEDGVVPDRGRGGADGQRETR